MSEPDGRPGDVGDTPVPGAGLPPARPAFDPAAFPPPTTQPSWSHGQTAGPGRPLARPTAGQPASPHWGPPPGWGPPPRPRHPMPDAETGYHWLWRSPWIKAWRPILAILLGAVGFLAITTAVVMVAMFGEVALNPEAAEAMFEGLLEGELTQTLFIANSVSLGLLVPFAFLLQRFVGQRPGFLSSVVGHVRWGWLMTCFGISLVAVAGFFGAGVLIEGPEAYELVPQPGWLLLLVLILLVTPFQAAGEEYAFRGILLRGVAALIPNNRIALGVGAVVSSALFALVHGAADPWLNLTYFTMGLLFCYLTWRTGGLEAAIAMHAANNLVALAIVPFQEWGGIFDRSEGTGGPIVLFQLVFLGVATIVIDVLARRRGVARSWVPNRP